MEILVDCYNESEQALGWYYYLEEHLRFPFSGPRPDRRLAAGSNSPVHLSPESWS
jgi:hypothetical protein